LYPLYLLYDNIWKDISISFFFNYQFYFNNNVKRYSELLR
jgi:hypothetical protein